MVVHGRGVVLKQPQRDFMLCGGLDFKLLELAYLVLDVLLVPSANELQVRRLAFAGRQDDQLPPILLILVVFVQI